MRRSPVLPGRLGNLLAPKSAEHKQKIAEGVKRAWQRRREAAAAEPEGGK